METILSQFDKWNSRENPKNPFGKIFQGVKRLIGIETPETIDYKNLEAHENLRITLGDATSKELIELSNAVSAYDAAAISLLESAWASCFTISSVDPPIK